MDIVVDDRYQIIKKISQGGCGHTYLANNLELPHQPKCVIKQLRPMVNNPWVLEMFQNEANILAKLRHDQIPQWLDYLEYNGDYFLVQDFIYGDDLSKEFKLGHQWTETKVIYFLREVLTVVDYIHNQNIVHCDIKPQNIIRRWDNGELILIDFGMAKDMVQPIDVNYDQIIAGTNGYISPEQSKGIVYFNSDIYAIGMSAIQFLTGQYPQHLPRDEGQEVIWHDLINISTELTEILTKMIRYDHDDRYQSAKDILTDLTELINSLSTDNPHDLGLFETPTELIANFSTKSSQQVLLGAAIAGLLVFGSYVISAYDRSHITPCSLCLNQER